MSRTEKPNPTVGGLNININLAACLLFAGCVAAGAAVVLEAWALPRWLPAGSRDLSGFFRVYFFALGIASGLAIPRRFWVCPLGVLVGLPIAGWCACGGSPGPFGALFLIVGTIAFCLISFGGALAGALLGTIVRSLTARRHTIASAPGAAHYGHSAAARGPNHPVSRQDPDRETPSETGSIRLSSPAARARMGMDFPPTALLQLAARAPRLPSRDRLMPLAPFLRRLTTVGPHATPPGRLTEWLPDGCFQAHRSAGRKRAASPKTG